MLGGQDLPELFVTPRRHLGRAVDLSCETGLGTEDLAGHLGFERTNPRRFVVGRIGNPGLSLVVTVAMMLSFLLVK